jgi:hypothetical protein
MANIWNMLFGGRGKVKQASTLNPMQQQLQQQLQSGLQGGPSNMMGMGYLQQLMSNDPQAFAEYEAPALRQFQQQIVPGIAERFSGMGMGAQGSSAFGQQLASAGGRLSQDLAAQRAGLRQGAMQNLMGMYGQAMQPGFQNYYQQPTQGMFPGLIGGAGQGAGYGAMGMLGNYYGMGGMGNYGMQGGWS